MKTVSDIQENLGKWILPLATALIAWGGYPEPPQVFVSLTRFELFRYMLLFILIWQGGAQQDFKTALIATAIMYFITKILEIRQMINDLQKRSAPIPQPMPQPMPQPIPKPQPVAQEESMQEEQEAIENFYHSF